MLIDLLYLFGRVAAVGLAVAIVLLFLFAGLVSIARLGVRSADERQSRRRSVFQDDDTHTTHRRREK